MQTTTQQPSTTPPIALVEAVLQRLHVAYGDPPPPSGSSPIDQLVATILSQHTSDLNTDRAFASLVRRFPTWQEVESATDAEVADAIRSGGLADRKAPRIRQVLKEVRHRRGNYDLSFLADLPLEEAKSWLISLPGVGPKTAACVLLFSLDMPAMPVDTHVHRVALRLGWLPASTSAERAHMLLEALVPPAQVLDAHLLLIQHGRSVCHARTPACTRCVVNDLCPSAVIFLGSEFSPPCA